jgi:hypothetical protein
LIAKQHTAIVAHATSTASNAPIEILSLTPHHVARAPLPNPRIPRELRSLRISADRGLLFNMERWCAQSLNAAELSLEGLSARTLECLTRPILRTPDPRDPQNA